MLLDLCGLKVSYYIFNYIYSELMKGLVDTYGSFLAIFRDVDPKLVFDSLLVNGDVFVTDDSAEKNSIEKT